MAAGRQNQNLSRKRYSSHSKEETHPYKNLYNQKSSAGGFHHLNTEHGLSSDGGIHNRRENGYTDDRELQVRSKEDAGSENGPVSGLSKKRKFSPIVWDRDEKQGKISKNKIVSTSSLLKLHNNVGVVDDDDQMQISPVESLVSNVSDLTPVAKLEHGQVLEKEDGEYVEERNLLKSKWAFEESPRIADIDNSSPESGEFKREGCEGVEDVSSLSFEEEKLEEDDENDDSHASEVPRCMGLDMMRCCRNVFEYERLNKISEGTYGVVYKARDKKTGEIVALKKVKMGKEREGFPMTSLREINILGSFQHPSIVGVKEVVMDDFNGVYMVMEYIDHELKGYMESMKQTFSQSEVKRLMLQLLEGVSYLHDNWVIHRDLKTSNLLLSNNGELKICDFGMSRQYGSPVKPYTPLVVTLWYRAPEILLGTKQYSAAIDMWSVGCIMAELLAKKPLFDGNRELEQIDKIFKTLGTPSDLIWPGYSKLPGVKSNLVKQTFNNLRKRFPVATFTGSPVLTELGFDLLNKLLTYDPAKRITAEEALNHGWFCEDPLPAQNVRICK